MDKGTRPKNKVSHGVLDLTSFFTGSNGFHLTDLPSKSVQKSWHDVAFASQLSLSKRIFLGSVTSVELWVV